MTYAIASINPFYADRKPRAPAPSRQGEAEQPVYARLPHAPKTGSPVPHLTILYHFHRAGEYGDRSWPGNCGGNLIKDLLRYFQPGLVFDPMSGSGTAVTCARSSASPAWPRISTRVLTPATPRISRKRNFRFHLGTPALLADEALRRRSARPVAHHRRSSTSCVRYGSSSGTATAPCNAAASWPSSWAIIPTAMPDTSRWSTTPSVWPSTPG